MKIITKGEIPKPALPKWVGLQLVCKNCNTVFELEENDKPIVTTPRGTEGVERIVILCPFCSEKVKYEPKK
jgi:RNase P subunit RPR2